MESVQSANLSINREQRPSDSSLTRPRARDERELLQNGNSIRAADEIRSPGTNSKAFESMLKTTTETGDIGMFSIRPPRVPPSVGIPRRVGGTNSEYGQRKPRQNIRHHGGHPVDDRRGLPSYAKDPLSEPISTYETASQKSSTRIFDDPDYRSYSMTQTSYSAYTLSNHRSYTSLRSQADGNGLLLQRPGSPLAYPARLKRPGFRPSTPSLADGGGLDYSQRAEIEQTAHGASYNASSPSSLYAQRRKPPLSLRPEANRSTPSLLSQSSPARRPLSPNIRQSSKNMGHDWPRRNDSASLNTSPARSTFSLASTNNLYSNVAAPSNKTIPGNLHPPSPLYYDYTEDFEADPYIKSHSHGPAPQFHIEKAIPKEYLMNVERSQSGQRQGSGSITSKRSHNASLTSAMYKSTGMTEISSTMDNPSRQVAQSHSVESVDSTSSCVNKLRETQGKEAITLSGLGFGGRELSTRVEEAFGLLPPAKFELFSPVRKKVPAGRATSHITQGNEIEKGAQVEFIEFSERTTSTYMPPFPPGPRCRDKSQSSSIKTLAPEYSCRSQNSTEASVSKGELSREIKFEEQKSSGNYLSEVGTRARFSLLNSSDTGLIELDDFITALEIPSRRQSQCEKEVLPMVPTTSFILSGNSISRVAKSERSLIPPLPSFYGNGTGNKQNKQDQLLKWNHGRVKKLETPAVHDLIGAGFPNFSHQIPKRIMPRSESPMLAPQPISPARQLKLKNSIPQLMKALPPVPPELSVCNISMARTHATTSESGLTCELSTPSKQYRASAIQEAPESFEKAFSTHSHLASKKPVDSRTVFQIAINQIVSTGESKGKGTCQISKPPPPKLRLRVKNPTGLYLKSQRDAEPWNLDESYPWSCQNPSIHLQPVASKRPKFKLKINQSSISTQGTAGVNRDSLESKPQLEIYLRSPKDFFTSASGLENIFKQVGKHIHSRRSSVNSNHTTRTSSCTASSVDSLASNSEYEPIAVEQEQNRSKQQSTLAKPPNSSQARSAFSDDSSRVYEQSSLRRRLSNLRARIAVSYASKAGATSDDDIARKERSYGLALKPFATRSIPKLRSRETNGERKPMQRLMEGLSHQKLKTKIRAWLREARSAIKARREQKNKVEGTAGLAKLGMVA